MTITLDILMVSFPGLEQLETEERMARTKTKIQISQEIPKEDAHSQMIQDKTRSKYKF